MTELELKQLKTFNDIIDRYCESIGVRMTIDMLVSDYGFTREEILAMNFDEDEVADYYQDVDENYF
jgi:lantibiotic modifying enzyme